VKTVATGSGMLALWRASAFADVDGYEAWETHVNERLHEAIAQGELVPVGIQADGAFAVRAAVAPEAATERESRYTVTTSEPYLFVADSGPVAISGIEAVGDISRSPIVLEVQAGRYAVRAALIAWDDEPGARGPDGLPGPTALPDFLVLLTPAAGEERFRSDEETFNPPA